MEVLRSNFFPQQNNLFKLFIVGTILKGAGTVAPENNKH
jgi:hypothetical protein